MKKGIYLTIITIITVICIIGGSLYHLVNFFSYFPFHSTGTSTNGTEESIDSASIKQLEGFDNIWADVDVSDYTRRGLRDRLSGDQKYRTEI